MKWSLGFKEEVAVIKKREMGKGEGK